MKVEIKKGTATGRVKAPPSKSMAHRLLICAALAEGESVIRGVSSCDDVSATVDCLTELGARFEHNGDTVRVTGSNILNADPENTLCCRESGSTLRFLIPLCLLLDKNVMMTGKGLLMQRPMGVYETLAKEKGVTFLHDGSSIVLRGPLSSGEYRVAGNVSSQFISGLLFALPLVAGDSRINIVPPVVSRPYIDMTLEAIREFGIKAEWENDHTLYIKGGQKYRPTETCVEGDYSGAAFFAALQALGDNVEIDGLKENSAQGDKIYAKYYKMLDNGIPTIHIGDCPDLGPVLFAVAAAKHGGIFTGTSRLRYKESDRGAAMANELRKFGTGVAVHENSIVVYPADFHAPCEELSSYNDHRIVMALSVLLTKTGGTINGAEAVKKSFPDFFSELSGLDIEVKCHEV